MLFTQTDCTAVELSLGLVGSAYFSFPLLPCLNILGPTTAMDSVVNYFKLCD